MPLFEVAILEQGKQKEDLERLVLGPVAVIAGDPEGAGILAVMEDVKNEHTLADIDPTRMKVLVRPFA
jgi:hypothetical protein